MTKSINSTYPAKISRIASAYFSVFIAAIGYSTADAAITTTGFETPDVATTTQGNDLFNLGFNNGYTANGFVFNGAAGTFSLRIIESDSESYYNGSQTLEEITRSPIRITREDGGTFTPVSTDFDGTVSFSPIVLAEGFYQDGTSITQSFFTDSGLGNQTFFYDTTTIIGAASNIGFNDIVRLEISAINFLPLQIDNFVADVAVVPEPNSAFALGFIALLSMGIVRRRR